MIKTGDLVLSIERKWGGDEYWKIKIRVDRQNNIW
jgi:hypothetical protein